jgi:membrane protein required for colicin V production
MLDVVLLAVIGISTLLGLMKGFVSIVISTLSWLLGGWAALMFGRSAAAWWSAPAAPGSGHYVAGYLTVFLLVMVSVWAIGLVVRQAVRSTSLNGADRMLGGGLGVARGGLIACVLLLLGSYTPLTREPTWRNSYLRVALDPGVGWMQAHMPRLPELPALPDLDAIQGLQALPAALPEVNMAQLPGGELGKPGATGDNGVLGQLLGGRGWPRPLDETPQQAVDPADVWANQARPGSPQNTDPARVRPDDTGPARSGSPGQARPPSQ